MESPCISNDRILYKPQIPPKTTDNHWLSVKKYRKLISVKITSVCYADRLRESFDPGSEPRSPAGCPKEGRLRRDFPGTPKNSTNSSKPPSQTPKDDTATTHPGANSKGNQHNGIRCANTRTIETVQTSPITQCETCGEDLSKTPCQKFERRDDQPALERQAESVQGVVESQPDSADCRDHANHRKQAAGPLCVLRSIG